LTFEEEIPNNTLQKGTIVFTNRMGGDDLEDDNDTLWMKPVRDDARSNEYYDDDDEEEDSRLNKYAGLGDPNPMKRHALSDDNHNDDNDNDDPNSSNSNSKKRQKKAKKQKNDSSKLVATTSDNPIQILFHIGQSIHEQSCIEQAKYLTTAMRHYTLLSVQNNNNNITTSSLWCHG
jgi:hypothetical protein